jgi:DNA-binding IclR family transcriptional regulator
MKTDLNDNSADKLSADDDGSSQEGGNRGGNGVMVKPIINAIRILRHLTETATPERAADLARLLSINPSTCFNILRTLVAEEIVEFDRRAKTYSAGLGLAKLVGNMVTEGQRLEAARPLMQEFAARFGVTVTLWRRMGADRIVLVSSETSPADLRIDMAAGQRLPMLMGASGRLFASRLDLSMRRSARCSTRFAGPAHLASRLTWKKSNNAASRAGRWMTVTFRPASWLSQRRCATATTTSPTRFRQ